MLHGADILTNGMSYISFHGGSDKNSLNNIHVYNDDGTPASPAKLLPQGDPQLAELRSFAFVNGLMVVNAYKKYSQLLQYTQSGSSWTASQTWASPKISSVDHPFDFVFDGNTCYLSSQDTGVVTVLSSPGTAGTIPGALTQNGVPATSYLQGTFVAACSDNLPNVTNAKVAVAQPLGLGVEVVSGKTANSVRGLAYWNGALLVADEVAGMVKAYSTVDGSLLSAAIGLESPVHLLINGSVLYISAKQGVMQTALPPQISFTTPLTPTAYIDSATMTAGGAQSAAGMCFGPERKAGTPTMFVADRKGNAVYYLSKGSLKPFIQKLQDSPEFIVYQA
jgi:hypothetical protein